MVDIHSHALYGVDDGAADIETTKAMLKDAASQGIRAIVFTPHYRVGMFDYPLDRIREAYEKAKDAAEAYGILTYLGCEYHADSDMVENLQSGRCLTLADSDYVLTEYKYQSSPGKIRGTSEELLSNGYTPVIAHAERYEVFIKDPELLAGFRSMGVLVQINADSILGKDGLKTKRLCKKILGQGLADIVASDSHNMTDRKNRMRECREYIARKYGEKTAERLLNRNPGRIIGDGRQQ